MKAAYVARAVMMISVALFALLTAGCGKVRQAALHQKQTNDLKHLGLMYQNYLDSNGGKAPANADELMKMAQSDPQAAQVVQAAKSGQYVILWGSTMEAMRKTPPGTSGTILGYEKDVPTAGGSVLMGDTSVKNMTAAEFKSAPKAGGK